MSLSSILSEKKTIEILLDLVAGSKHLRRIQRSVGGSLSTISDRIDMLAKEGLVNDLSSGANRTIKLTTKGQGIASFLKALDTRLEKTESPELHNKPIQSLLTVLYGLGGVVKGSTRLEKLIFMFQELEKRKSYEFEPQIFGPYSREIMKDARRLQGAGLLEIVDEPFESWDLSDWFVIRRDYILTEKGKEIARDLFNEWNENNRLNTTVLELQRLNSMPLNSLVDDIHDKYPQYNKSSPY